MKDQAIYQVSLVGGAAPQHA